MMFNYRLQSTCIFTLRDGRFEKRSTGFQGNQRWIQFELQKRFKKNEQMQKDNPASYEGRICLRIIEPKSFFAPQWAANSVSNTKVLVNINLPSLTITHNTVNV